MGYKTITTILTDERADAAALHAGRALADANEGHLDAHCLGIDVTQFEPMPVGAAAVLLDSSQAEAQARAAEVYEWAKSRLPDDMANVSLHPMTIPQLGVETLVSRLARYSDLVVATKPYGKGRDPILVSVLEAELFGTNVPVLVVPDTPMIGSQPFRRVLVAWNESSESFNAVRGALPILMAADQVDLVMVDPPSHSAERSDPGGAIGLMLARHGVHAEVTVLARTLPRVSDILARFATDHGSDLIVMGGYGHSRFREAVLGGATRDMLESTTLPLLMAH